LLTGIAPLGRPASSRAEELVRRIQSLVSELDATEKGRLGSKEQLRKSFQVAHGTMNEALRVLESRGVVELRRGVHGGVFVGAPSVYIRLGNGLLGFRGDAASIEQCLAVRNQIEPMTIVEATKVALEIPDDVAELFAIVEKMKGAIDIPSESLRWNWQLHRRIAKMGRNGVLTGIYLTLLDFIEQELTEIKPPRTRSVAERVVEMHFELVVAIASGDLEKAQEAAKNHPLPLEEDAAPPLAKPRIKFQETSPR
jgi:DNA-binding FadR family transcriptional regulator